jgi:hypothetical protein
MPVNRVLMNKFIGDINEYDRARIISEAKKEDISKLQQ